MNTITERDLNKFCHALAKDLLKEADGDKDRALDLAYGAGHDTQYAIYYGQAMELCRECNIMGATQSLLECGYTPKSFEEYACMLAAEEINIRTANMVIEIKEEEEEEGD